jgi:hypothetical protein
VAGPGPPDGVTGRYDADDRGQLDDRGVGPETPRSSDTNVVIVTPAS